MDVVQARLLVVARLLVCVVRCCFVRGYAIYCVVALLFRALNSLNDLGATEVAKFVLNWPVVPVLFGFGSEFQSWFQSCKP